MCEAILGNQSLYEDIDSYGVSNSYSSLYPLTDGASPDDSFSDIPYEKGYQFLYYLTTFIGGDMMEQFIQSYILKYQEQSVNYTQLNATWVDFINENIDNETEKNYILDTVNWTLWVREAGYPPVHFNFSNPDQQAADDLAI